MSFGTHRSWRLLSPFIALAWVVLITGFAGTARADTSPGRGTEQTAAAGDHAGDTTRGSDAARGGTAGDPTQPQPISTADANTGGANGHCPGGPYCSTRDGSASGNGNGGGLATGEPCAGCVGKADNKNPSGQLPDASDGNAGYECDTNHGIARTNPAHTGCATGPEQGCVPTPTLPCVPAPGCVPTPSVPCVPAPGCVPTPTVPCVPAPGCVPTPTVPCVSAPQGVVEAPVQGAVVATQASVSPPAQILPSTGAPASAPWLVALAVTCLAVGATLVARRRHPAGV